MRHLNPLSSLCDTQGSFGLRGKGEGVEESKIDLAENRLILDQLYSISLPSPQFKRTANDGVCNQGTE